MNRIQTRAPMLRRLASNRWVVAILAFCVIFALCGVAEAGCELLGAGYDERIETAS